MNEHLFEAAQDLGASGTYTFFRIILPEIMPGIISGFLLSITLSIDDFVISLFAKGPGVNTLSVHVYNMAKRGVVPSINALSTLLFVAVMVLLLIINRRSGKGDVEIEKN